MSAHPFPRVASATLADLIQGCFRRHLQPPEGDDERSVNIRRNIDLLNGLAAAHGWEESIDMLMRLRQYRAPAARRVLMVLKDLADVAATHEDGSVLRSALISKFKSIRSMAPEATVKRVFTRLLSSKARWPQHDIDRLCNLLFTHTIDDVIQDMLRTRLIPSEGFVSQLEIANARAMIPSRLPVLIAQIRAAQIEAELRLFRPHHRGADSPPAGGL